MVKRKLGRGLDILISRGSAAGGRGRASAGAAADRRSSGDEPDDRAGHPVAGKELPPDDLGNVRVVAGKGPPPEGTADREDESREAEFRLRELDPASIELNPTQPRKRFSPEELQALKDSVAREGILQPVLVRETDGRYQLVAGERRLRAAQELGLAAIPARIIEIPEKRLLELALIENIHRANLNPIELAEAYRHLMEVNRWTQAELSEKLAVSRPNIANTVRLLDLPGDMQEALSRNQISPGHAKVLLSIDDPQQQRMFFEKIAEENLSVRELEDARELELGASGEEAAGRKRGKRPRNRAAEKKPYLISLEEELAEALRTRVQIREHGGKGVLSISFYSKDEFQRLRTILLSSSDK